MTPQRVVVVGGGFAGLAAVRGLRDAPFHITLIDRSNHHLFQPLLYQVATGLLAPANIAVPLRRLVRRQRNVEVLLAEVTDIDLEARRVRGERLDVPYDTLIVATGASHDYFGQEWSQLAPGLKTVGDATEIRRRILGAFEAAELANDPDDGDGWLTFVVVGGGPTGVELVGTLAELARVTLSGEFRRINPARARILLAEGADEVLQAYTPGLRRRALHTLRRLGIEVRTGTRVVDVRPDHVMLQSQTDGTIERVATHTVIWAAGVRASKLGEMVAGRSGTPTDRAGRVQVTPRLTLAGHDEVFVLGDLAAAPGADGRPLPGLAAVALQQGRYAARSIVAALCGEEAVPFEYHDLGSMAVVGRGFAVADLGYFRLWGRPGWLVWAALHLARIIDQENRVLALVQWTWSYLTSRRPARLIVRR